MVIIATPNVTQVSTLYSFISYKEEGLTDDVTYFQKPYYFNHITRTNSLSAY